MASFLDMLTLRVGITDNTEETDLDRYFTNVRSYGRPVVLVFDTTQCSRITLNKALSFRRVLSKNRAFVDHSEILVRGALARRVLRAALCIVRPDRPVKISRL